MEMNAGSCRLGLWFVNVYWTDAAVHRIRFASTGISGPVPPLLRQYCAGKPVDPVALTSTALDDNGMYGEIYRIVRTVPYGRTATYGEVAERAGTIPRVVGQAMARNPTPLVIPCHRIVGADGPGGFTPSVGIKLALLEMERKAAGKKRTRVNNR